jgi:hypothetical protein
VLKLFKIPFVCLSFVLLFLLSASYPKNVFGWPGCGVSCGSTAECATPPPGQIGTVTCTANNNGNYSVGAGTCSCTTALSESCPGTNNCPWDSAGCINGLELLWCHCNGNDTQIRSCVAPTPVGTGGPGPTSPPLPVTCNISLTPSVFPLTLGGADGTITATVSCSAPINNVTFTSSNPAIANIVSAATDTTAPYTTTVHGVTIGGVIITGTVNSSGYLYSATAIVNVTPLSGWFQVKDFLWC